MRKVDANRARSQYGLSLLPLSGLELLSVISNQHDPLL